VPAFKPKPGTWSVTPFGWVLFALLAAAVIVAAVGSGSMQVVGLVAAALVGFVLVGGGMSGGSARRRTGKTLAARRAEFGPRRRRLGAAAEPVGNDDVWERERALRQQREQSEEPLAQRPAEMPDIGL
jgi:hypothetical protein